MYSLYPNRTTGFLVQVDLHNLSLRDVEAFSTGADFSPEVSPPCVSESDTDRRDSSFSVSASDTFIFPLSLRVNHLLGYLRWECTAKSPLLAVSPSDWSNRPSPPHGPLNRTEIGLSGRVSISGSSRGISASLTSPLELSFETGFVSHGMSCHTGFRIARNFRVTRNFVTYEIS
jgi:hypothetical protein